MCGSRHTYIIIAEGVTESTRTQISNFLLENRIKATILDKPITIHEVTD